MSGFARLALGRGEDYYLNQFLFHLESGRINSLNRAQCQAVAALLDHLYETNTTEIEEDMDDGTLGHLMGLLDRRIAVFDATAG